MQPATGMLLREPAWTVVPALGLVAGWLLLQGPGWATAERWRPFRGVFRQSGGR